MNRISNIDTTQKNNKGQSYEVPFRCVTQWATYQTGKQKDTLGLTIPISLPDSQFAGDPFSPFSEHNVQCYSANQKKASRGKKSSAKPGVTKAQK